MSYGYRLACNASSASVDFIPSLIGITLNQIAPGGSDSYFEMIELPEEAFDLTSVALSRWVSYDSTPAEQRDPILAVKAGPYAYYHLMSELTNLLKAAGKTDSLRMISTLRRSVVA